jgi:ligand-binding sensor domain-containing protein
MFKKFDINNIIFAFIIVAGFLQTGLLAATISIEELISTADKHFGDYIAVEGYAACPECFQIESGGCSGINCTGNLVLQESPSGGPSVIITGTYNGKRVNSESDGCELKAWPLTIGINYRVWGQFLPFASSSEATNYTIALDSFKVLAGPHQPSNQGNGDYAEGTGIDKMVYSFDRARTSGKWSHVKCVNPRRYLDDELTVIESGTFKGRFINGAWDGPWISYFANGKVKERGVYGAGAKLGVWEEFDAAGKLISQGPFTQGQESGTWKKTLRGGVPPALLDYKAQTGKIVITEFAADSALSDRVTIDRVFSTVEKFETFYSNGKKRRVVSHDPHSATAAIQEWREDGGRRCVQSFANGVFSDSLWYPSGELWKVKKKDSGGGSYAFLELHKNGKTAWIGKFKGFSPSGAWLHFSEQGVRIDSINYACGAPSTSEFAHTAGSHVFTSFTNTNNVAALESAPQGIWAGTSGGVCLFAKNGTFLSKLTTGNGLPGIKSTALAGDPTGTLWVGTEHNAKIPETSGSACCISFVGEPLVKLITQNGFLGGAIGANSDDTVWKNSTTPMAYLLGARAEKGSWRYFDTVTVNQYAAPITKIALGADQSVWNSSLNGLRRLPKPLPNKLRDRLGPYADRPVALGDSSMWVVGMDSLYRIKGDSITAYRPADSQPTGDLISLQSGSDGKLYLLAAKGIFFFTQNQFVKIIGLSPDIAPLRASFYRDSDNSFLIATARGIERVSKTTVTIVVGSAQLNNAAITAFVRDAKTFWIGTKEGVFRAEGNHVSLCAAPDGPRGEHIETVRVDANHGVWIIVMDKGIYHFNGATWDLFDTQNKLPNHQILDLAPDPNGGAWVGCDKGLLHLSSTPSVDVAPKTTLNGAISQMAYDKHSTLWFVRDETGIVAFNGNAFRTVYEQPILIDGVIRAFALDSAGVLWVSNNRGIVRVVNGQPRETFTSATGLPLAPITRLFIDAKNIVYAVSLQTVYAFDGLHWTSVFTEDNINGAVVSALSGDNIGNLWVGTKNGLLRFGEHEREWFTQLDGLIGNGVNDIAADTGGAIWIATEKGLSKLDYKRVSDTK